MNDLIAFEPKIQSLVSKIKISQDLFFKENGRYFQSLKTGSAEGLETVPDIAIKATHEKKNIPKIEFVDKLPFEIEIHELYNQEKGKGFTIYLRRKIGDKIQTRSIGQGIGITSDWVENLFNDPINLIQNA